MLRTEGDAAGPPLTPGQAELAARYCGLALRIGDEFARDHGLRRDEVRSYLHEQVCRIAQDFDPARGEESGLVYFRWRLRRCLIDYLRHALRRRQVRATRSLDDLALSADERDLMLRTEDRELSSLGDREHVESLLRRLPADQAALLRRHYLGGEPREEIARDLGLGREALDTRILRALNRLRDLATVKGCRVARSSVPFCTRN